MRQQTMGQEVTVQRRAFLRGVGSIGATSLLTACARPFQLSRSAMIGANAPGIDQRDPHGLWREAAAYARWTPSPHNIQPWLLRVHSSLFWTSVRSRQSTHARLAEPISA